MFKRYNPDNEVHQKLKKHASKNVKDLVENHLEEDYVKESELARQIKPISDDLEHEIKGTPIMDAGYSKGYIRTLLKDIRPMLMDDGDVEIERITENGSEVVIYRPV